jgi:peptidoglycan-associated lipoprotein
MKTRNRRYLLVLVSAAVLAGCAREPKTAELTVPPPAAPELSVAAPAAAPEPEAVETPHPENVAVRPEAREFAPSPRLHDIHFDFDQYVVRPQDTKILDANIDWMLSNPKALVLIEGHCDERGTNDYNTALGDHRARATANYLMAHGVLSERITTLSYGEERPLCTERTEACWARNRRAHFLVRLGTPAR